MNKAKLFVKKNRVYICPGVTFVTIKYLKRLLDVELCFKKRVQCLKAQALWSI